MPFNSSNHHVTYDNPYAPLHNHARSEPIRIVFVDFSEAVNNQEMMIDPNLPYHEFLSRMTGLTALVAHRLPNLSHPKYIGQGMTLADGCWHYRLVKPFEYDFSHCVHRRNRDHGHDHQGQQQFNQTIFRNHTLFRSVHRSGLDREDWTPLNSLIGYQRMIDRMGYGYRLQGSWIEIQHQMQKERDEQDWSMAMASTIPQYQTMHNSFHVPMYPNNAVNTTGNLHPAHQMQASQPYMVAEPYHNHRYEHMSVEGPLIIDGGRQVTGQATIKTTITVSPEASEAEAAQNQVFHPFTWQPPRPGVLDAPGTGMGMQSTLPPIITTMPDTIDPSVLLLRPDEGSPRVRMPALSHAKSIDDKLFNENGHKIVFGFYGEPSAADIAIEQTTTTSDNVTNVSGPLTGEVNEAMSSESPDQDETSAARVIDVNVSVKNEKHTVKRGRGRGRGRFRGSGRGRGRGQT